jgi:hypothetical protein
VGSDGLGHLFVAGARLHPLPSPPLPLHPVARARARRLLVPISPTPPPFPHFLSFPFLSFLWGVGGMLRCGARRRGC